MATPSRCRARWTRPTPEHSSRNGRSGTNPPTAHDSSADAKHSRLDALSSAGALVGLILVALGNRWGDPIAGLAVTMFIVHVGYEVTTEIVRNLDGRHRSRKPRRWPPAVPGVQPATVRGRWADRVLTLDVDGSIDAVLTDGQADQIGAEVLEAVLSSVDEARDVLWAARSSAARVLA